MKRILLVDSDGKIPNIALMKLAAMHKGRRNAVKLVRLGMGYYPPNRPKFILANNFNRAYVSTLFTPNRGLVVVKGCKVMYGGTGNDLHTTLPNSAEACNPDYSVYPDFNYSVGFISRGCIRKCSFCLVPEKEGKLKQVENPVNIIKHKKVLFLDNNFLALKNHAKLLSVIAKTGASFQFNQGLDARLLTERTAKLLAKAKRWGALYFAYDLTVLKKSIEPSLRMMAKKIPVWSMRVYLYAHPSQGPSDISYRVRFCLKYKILPYVMRDLVCWKDSDSNFWVDLASWANQPALIKNLSFQTFLRRRHPKKEQRQKASLKLYEE
ncbi:MAG: hypothetical protein NG740_07225 [Omnitrophica bacterium]|nr:hypothetical protein [Candidatus Omnitrophota bacterium]